MRTTIPRAPSARYRSKSIAARPTRHDADRCEGVYGPSLLIKSRPFDAHGALRPGSRRCHLEDFALEVDRISRSNRRKPAQLIYAEPQLRVRPKGMRLNSQPHRHRGRVPARRSEPMQWRLLSGRFVKVIGLRIEFRCKALDVLTRYKLLGTLKAHADAQIVEPLDHIHAAPSDLAYRRKSTLSEISPTTLWLGDSTILRAIGSCHVQSVNRVLSSRSAQL